VRAALGGTRVLVVDDDDDTRTLVTTVLDMCGCDVRAASNVDKALRAFDEEVPDVLVSDIGMPEKDGFDLIRRVRERPAARGGDVPAAALTAHARPEDRERVLGAGYLMHVAKPVDPVELVNVVTSLARRGRAAHHPGPAI
jgi:CheY-like chemotaxis protein